MSTTSGPVSQVTMEERSVRSYNQAPFDTNHLISAKSSPRFGTMSYHSFFSRHNPHPHRVTHIQGLNGRPVCTVKDDWCVTTSLFPHPIIKSQGLRSATGAFLPLGPSPYGSRSNQWKPGLLPEAWREELKELASKVILASETKNAKEKRPGEEEEGRRRTQYSAQTGRIIPASTKAYQRRAPPQRHAYPQPLQDQELLVLELLCQILQTDSLSLVQKWLLLAGNSEKSLVMGLIQQALQDIKVLGHCSSVEQFQPLYPSTTLSAQGSLFGQSHQKPRRSSSSHVQPSAVTDRPERIGGAEVLEIHHED